MFDDRLRLLRVQRNLSQAEMAEILGMKLRTYASYENNEREPSSAVLIKIADYFNVSSDFLIGYKMKGIDKQKVTEELIGKLEDLTAQEIQTLNLMADATLRSRRGE